MKTHNIVLLYLNRVLICFFCRQPRGIYLPELTVSIVVQTSLQNLLLLPRRRWNLLRYQLVIDVFYLLRFQVNLHNIYFVLQVFELRGGMKMIGGDVASVQKAVQNLVIVFKILLLLFCCLTTCISLFLDVNYRVILIISMFQESKIIEIEGKQVLTISTTELVAQE